MKTMKIQALKKALLYGIPNGIVTWLIYGMVFKLLIDKKPFKEALFDRDSIVFLVIATIVEIVIYYVSQVRKIRKK